MKLHEKEQWLYLAKKKIISMNWTGQLFMRNKILALFIYHSITRDRKIIRLFKKIYIWTSISKKYLI